jgi:hypothetical protein
VQVADVVAAVGVETGDGEGVAELLDRPGEQRHRFLTQFENALLAAAGADLDLVGQRLREVEQDQYRQVAAVAAVAHVDARIGAGAALEVDQRTQGDIEIEFAAVFLVANADLVLRFEEVQQTLQTPGQRGVFFRAGGRYPRRRPRDAAIRRG